MKGKLFVLLLLPVLGIAQTRFQVGGWRNTPYSVFRKATTTTICSQLEHKLSFKELLFFRLSYAFSSFEIREQEQDPVSFFGPVTYFYKDFNWEVAF